MVRAAEKVEAKAARARVSEKVKARACADACAARTVARPPPAAPAALSPSQGLETLTTAPGAAGLLWVCDT